MLAALGAGAVRPVDRDAEQQPAAHEVALVLAQGLDGLAQRGERRRPVQLADDMAVDGGDLEHGADRGGAL